MSLSLRAGLRLWLPVYVLLTGVSYHMDIDVITGIAKRPRALDLSAIKVANIITLATFMFDVCGSINRIDLGGINANYCSSRN